MPAWPLFSCLKLLNMSLCVQTSPIGPTLPLMTEHSWFLWKSSCFIDFKKHILWVWQMFFWVTHVFKVSQLWFIPGNHIEEAFWETFWFNYLIHLFIRLLCKHSLSRKVWLFSQVFLHVLLCFWQVSLCCLSFASHNRRLIRAPEEREDGERYTQGKSCTISRWCLFTRTTPWIQMFDIDRTRQWGGVLS